MKIIEEHITRRDVITYYIEYDRQKKGQPVIENLEAWPWNDPNAIDEQLQSNHLKPGVLSAYRVWQLAQLDYADIVDCAIVNHIFRGQPQALGRIDQNLISESKPNGNPEWWGPLSSGSDIPRGWALILRPTVATERPTKWYIEDGSGRALALFQRMLVYQELLRTAYEGVAQRGAGDFPPGVWACREPVERGVPQIQKSPKNGGREGVCATGSQRAKQAETVAKVSEEISTGTTDARLSEMWGNGFRGNRLCRNVIARSRRQRGDLFSAMRLLRFGSQRRDKIDGSLDYDTVCKPGMT